MGDHRAEIEVNFKIHGKTYHTKWDWKNYSPDYDGVDGDVKEWFSDCWDDAYMRYKEIIEEGRKAREEEERAKRELKEYERLKKKFEQVGEKVE